MDTGVRFIIVGLLLVIGNFQVSAQKKKVLATTEEVAAVSAEVFVISMKPEGVLYEVSQKNQLTGEYTLDITVGDKGKVVSVFAVERNGGSIKEQNRLIDNLMAMKLGFKVVKGKRFKFRYKFNFNK